MVLGCLRVFPLREHSKYLRRRNRLPLRPPTPPTREVRLFTALSRAVPEPKSREARKNAWISVATWRIFNDRFSARRYPARDQELIRRLGRAINTILEGELRQRMEEAGEGVERLMGTDPPPPPGILAPGEGVVLFCGQL